ncbi:MAG: hypothetical protein H6P98_1333 [Candidatus Aminicenantes bacterium]|nr:hypothetical protein [Candidatus Aminicenantes bacterium]
MKNSVSRMCFFVCLLFLSAAVGMADYLTVPACAFHGYYTDASSAYFVATYTNVQYIYTLTQPGDAGYCFAPVNLPQGARIDGIVLYYMDNDGGANIEAKLQRHYQATADAYVTLFTATSYGASNWVNSLADYSLDGGTRLVNNNSFQYSLRLQFGAATDQLRCYGVKIVYHF